MTTWPQTDDVIRLTSLSIHHGAGVDMSDSPTLAFLAGTGLHIRHTFLPVLLADSSSASRESPRTPEGRPERSYRSAALSDVILAP